MLTPLILVASALAGPTCEDGQRPVDEAHCCWPGQRWDGERAACVGAPACPEGWMAHDEVCLPGNALGALVGPGLVLPADIPPPKVLEPAPGQLDREVIARVVREHQAGVRSCYQAGLASEPALAGKIVVRFVIDPTGAVRESSTDSSTLGNPTVETCINEHFRALTFPEPAGGGLVVVSWPVVLQPK